MLAMIIRETPEGDEYTFVEKPRIWYIGELLAEEQKNNLRAHHNTVIAEKILLQLGEEKVLNEIERLTGIKCIIKKHEHYNDEGKADHSYIVWRKPVYVLDTTADADNYVLFVENYGNKVEKLYSKQYLDKLGRKELLSIEALKKLIKKDGYTRVRII